VVIGVALWHHPPCWTAVRRPDYLEDDAWGGVFGYYGRNGDTFLRRLGSQGLLAVRLLDGLSRTAHADTHQNAEEFEMTSVKFNGQVSGPKKFAPYPPGDGPPRDHTGRFTYLYYIAWGNAFPCGATIPSGCHIGLEEEFKIRGIFSAPKCTGKIGRGKQRKWLGFYRKCAV